MSANDCLTQLVHELTSEPVGRKGLGTELERRFVEEGMSAAVAAEMSERFVPVLVERLEEALAFWDAEDIPRPVELAKNGSVAFGIIHQKYEGKLPSHFFEVLEDVQTANESSLLGIAALYCIAVGCDRVFITDKGGGDSGVDVLARKRSAAGAAHTIIAVQCKAESHPAGPLSVATIAHRFRDGMQEVKRWKEYFRAIGASELQSSPGILFGVIASKGLSNKGSQKARDLGVFSSSSRQIAHIVASRWSREEIAQFCSTVPNSRDLRRNLVNEMTEIMQE